jgi:uncharacterized protein (DUF488 family)
MRRLYTIGHSTDDFARFAGRLAANGVTAVCDVRSSPYSGYAPDYSRERLKRLLAERGVEYFFLGGALGARPADRACYENGVATYARIAAIPAFGEGLDKLARCTEKFVPALMCAEKDPVDCHRAILVARNFAVRAPDVAIAHIDIQGRPEPHAEFESRLLALHESRDAGFLAFDPVATRQSLDKAYAIQGERIAYAEKTEAHQTAAAK